MEKPKTQAFSSFAYFSFAGFEVKGLLFVFFNVRTPGVDASFQGEPNKKEHWEILTSTRDKFQFYFRAMPSTKGRISSKKTKLLERQFL